MRTLSWLGVFGTVVVACGGSVSLGNNGSGLNGTDAGTDAGGATECASTDACGPAPKSASYTCGDGSLGGPTGKCLKATDGTCAWEIRTCPATPTCFDAAGDIDASYKKCTTAADCSVITFQRDCCGTMRVAGVEAKNASSAELQQCIATRTAGFPACGCASQSTIADDGSQDTGGAKPAVVCNAKSQCETSYKTTACGSTTCTAAQTCCSGVPFPNPTCVDGTMCPISQRKAKKDIAYLAEEDKQRLAEELLRFPLATYRYKVEGDAERPHLGFIIDDVAPTPAVVASGERVDMYGYSTMAVAAIQTQAREIAELKKQIADLRRDLEASQRASARKK